MFTLESRIIFPIANFLIIPTPPIFWDSRVCCSKNNQQKFDKKLKEEFFNTYRFSNHDNNKFVLLWRKRFYHYEYMDYGKNKT